MIAVRQPRLRNRRSMAASRASSICAARCNARAGVWPTGSTATPTPCHNRPRPGSMASWKVTPRQSRSRHRVAQPYVVVTQPLYREEREPPRVASGQPVDQMYRVDLRRAEEVRRDDDADL